MNRILIQTAVLALSLAGGTATAQTVQVPHTFEAGTPARAEEVNQNFDAGAVAINDNAMDIAALMERLDALEVQDISVDCDNGESIQDAVDKARETANINVSGTCFEGVVIQGDHLHILGNKVATIMPPAGSTAFNVVSTDNVRIEGFTILGGAGGFHIQRSSASIFDNQILNSTSVGINIRANSFAFVRDNLLDSTSGNFSQIFVAGSSDAFVRDNIITASSGDGINAGSASSVSAAGNIVSGTAGFGIAVEQNAHMTLFTENTVNTIFCGFSGSLEVDEVQMITGGAGAVSLDAGCDLANFSGAAFPP